MSITKSDNKILSLEDKIININEDTTETWIMGNNLGQEVWENSFKINFISNNCHYTYIILDGREVIYDRSIKPEPHSDRVYNGSSWTDQAYRTITFLEPPTNDAFLEWLKLYGRKQ